MVKRRVGSWPSYFSILSVRYFTFSSVGRSGKWWRQRCKSEQSMRLFEAIIEANHRAVAGDQSAGVRPADFADELPLIALTCVDPRLNAFFPNVLARPAEEFIWLRTAGNSITGPLSGT